MTVSVEQYPVVEAIMIAVVVKSAKTVHACVDVETIRNAQMVLHVKMDNVRLRMNAKMRRTLN